ncbi:hypothetical protein AAZX31_20G095000 [Glycine max]|uniref:Uncharacterized protein n=2 Tax=Glycine subgen. Soja TaxID=1462606 RepID=I1NF78_SOYBN|nr:hypothetical protein JHK86_055887 [Glycine max]KAG4910037.1 hypothetical protein JHK87_056153 [Glycine soja]KAG4918628.1 hypothetical protein JHK85_056909 [Glycine max]KAG5074699.1 hypothetical protein JHK84_055930 [Glycine max]KAG5077366.1 hypothetical protein JHK82_056061 [Glycine max]
MELKGASLRRGYELLKGQKQKKNRLAKESNIVPKGKGNGVVSCTEEVGGVVRMKIVVRKSELKQLVEVMNGGVKSTMHVSSVEQRLNLLWKKKYLSRAKGNPQKCWSPVLQSIPEEKLV